MIGTKLSHFKITAKLGEGGMGEVYRAEDTRLGREVAIKVLPEAVVADAERLARFEREARVLASLSHQNIAAIYEVGEQEDVHFLVMELVEGETLAERIAKGPIPSDEAVRIAIETAMGLEAAHESAIVHRDLKPANVKLDSDGKVKILDFGLAKAVSSPEKVGNVADLSASPTLSAEMTRAGVVLGTPTYMSPEQARGQEVDKRSDIWAFGVMLYEMLTGSQLFASDTVSDALVAILRDEIDFDALPAETPPIVTRLLRRCLERDPRQRLHDIADARLDLEELERGEDPFAPATVPPAESAKGSRIARSVGIAVLALLVGLAIGRLAFRSPPDDATEPLHVALNLPEGTRLSGRAVPVLALSPNGRKAAYVAHGPEGKHLYVHHLDTGRIQRIEGSDEAEGPFFSPDGEWVAFGAGRLSGPSELPPQLRKVSLATGIAQTICPVEDYYGGTWAEDGTIYFADELVKGLFRVDSDGGEPVSIDSPTSAEARQLARHLVYPQMLPGGRWLLVVSWSGPQAGRLLLVDVTTGSVRDLEIDAVFARYVPTGHLVYVTKDTTLSAIPFDLDRQEVYGSPVALLQDLALDEASALAISQSGTLLYATGYLRGSGRELSSLVRLGTEGKIADLGFPPDVFWRRFELSPDQSRLVIATWDGSLWIYDLERGTRSRLPRGGLGYRRVPVWSPDGEVLVTAGTSVETGWELDLFQQPADGSGPPEPLLIEPDQQWPKSFDPESGKLLYLNLVDGLNQIWALPLDSPQDRRPLFDMEETHFFEARVSPDGQWIAYVTSAGENNELQLRSYPDLGASVQISLGGAWDPRWGPLGDRLYYKSGYSLLVAEIGDNGTPSIGRELFNLPTLTSIVPANDGSFVAIERDPQSGVVTQLRLVLNWGSELARRVPTNSPG